MLIEDSLSITIGCAIMVLIGFIWTINILRIAFADNVDKITKIAFNGLKWMFILTLLMWLIEHLKSYIDWTIKQGILPKEDKSVNTI